MKFELLAAISLLTRVTIAHEKIDSQDFEIDLDYYVERDPVLKEKPMKRKLDHDYSSDSYSYSDYYYSDSYYSTYYDNSCNCDDSYYSYDYYDYYSSYDYSYYSDTSYSYSYSNDYPVYSGFYGVYSTSYTFSYSYDFSSYDYDSDVSSPSSNTAAHSNVDITHFVFQNDAYIETGNDNFYHYIWITNPSCDKVNYIYNNKGGGQYALKAVWADDGNTIKHFEVDTDVSNYDTTIYYVVYNSDGMFDYVTGSGGEKYYKHNFFTLPFDYTLYDCNADTNTSTAAYSDAFTSVVYQEDQYVGTDGVNDYHWVWLTSCDGINYIYNNKVGQQWRMKAYKNADGFIQQFEFDNDNIYFSQGTRYEYSAVTWNTDSTIAQITGPGQEPFTAHASFTTTFDYTVTTCNTATASSRRRALWADITQPVEESPVGQTSYYDSYYGGSNDYDSTSYQCECESSQGGSQNGFMIFLQHFFAWLSAIFADMV